MLENLTSHSVSISKYGNQTLVFLASLIAILPIFITDFPPCVDIPQHAAQIALFKGTLNSSNPFANMFSIHWLTPYLTGYIIIIALNSIFNITLAIKITIAFALFMIPWSTSKLLETTQNTPLYALFTIPAIYGFSFNWGFLNFMVAAPLGILFTSYMIQYSEEQNTKKAFMMSLLINLLFFCHALIWLYFSLISVLYILASTRNIHKTFLKSLPLLSSLPLAIFWLFHTVLKAQPSTGIAPTVYALGWWRINILPLIYGNNNTFTNTITILATIVLPLLYGAKFSRNIARWSPLIITLLIILLVPHTLLNVPFIYERFGVFVLPFFLITLNTDKPSIKYVNTFKFATLGIVFLYTLNEFIVMSGFKEETLDFKEILTSMRPGQRVISLMFSRNSSFSTAPVYLHFPLWYQAERQGLVEYNFANGFMLLVQYKHDSSPANISGFEWNPQSFNWNTSQAIMYKYFLARAPIDPGPFIFSDSGCKIFLKKNIGVWWLYERIIPTPSHC